MKNKLQIALDRGYHVDNEGICLNKNGKQVGYKNGNYNSFNIRIDNKFKCIRIHRLQAYQKFGTKLFKKGCVVRHLDGDSLNNSIDNIEIGTQSQNMMDVPIKMRVVKAKYASSFMKLNLDYNKIKQFHKIKSSYKETMSKFNIKSKSTLSKVLNS